MREWMREWSPDDECGPECDGLGLVYRFFDSSPAFTLGVETGMVSERMQAGAREPFTRTVHTDNCPQFLHMAKALGWGVRFEPVAEGWSLMHAAPASHTPHPS